MLQSLGVAKFVVLLIKFCYGFIKRISRNWLTKENYMNYDKINCHNLNIFTL